MSTIKTYRILVWAVILLLLCNIALVLTIWLKPAVQSGPRGESPRDFVIRNLKFTDEQVRQYDVLVHEHQQAMRRLRHEAMDYRRALFAHMKNDGKASLNTDSLAQLIAANQKQIELVTYEHFRVVRTLCNDAQKAEFDNIIGDVIKKMNGPGNGPHPPRPGGEGPPPPDGERPPPPEGQRPPPDGRAGPPPPP